MVTSSNWGRGLRLQSAWLVAEIILISAVANDPALGQSRTPVVASAGDIVRITTPTVPPGSFEGYMVDFRNGVLRFKLANDEIRDLSVDHIERLQIARDHGNTGLGAIIGLTSGMLVGALIGSQQDSCSSEHYCSGFESDSDGAVLGATLFAIPGLLIGAVYGYHIKTRSWHEGLLDISISPASPPVGDTPPSTSLSVRVSLPIGR